MIDVLNNLTVDAGFELTERLCIYEKYINDEWLNDTLLEKTLNLLKHQ